MPTTIAETHALSMSQVTSNVDLGGSALSGGGNVGAGGQTVGCSGVSMMGNL